MKKVLILAYYFPPFGLSGVQRILKFVKYLPDFGWQPTVVTTEPHAYLAFDDSFLRELDGKNIDIWRTPIAGVFSVLGQRKTIPLKNERWRKALNRISQFVFFPDNKISWKNKALQLLAERDCTEFDAVFSTAPPFSSHLTGVEIKRRYGIPLVVDYRDAWVDNPYILWTPLHQLVHRYLERRVMRQADAMIATNHVTVASWLRRYQGTIPAEQMYVVEQGFDQNDFLDVPEVGANFDAESVHFVYTGIFYDKHTPIPLYRALSSIKKEQPSVYEKLQFHMVGYVQDEYRSIARELGVDDRFVYHGYVEHKTSIAWLMKADVVWLLLSDSERYSTVSPGKTFEYLGSQKPILGIVGHSYTKEVLERFSHTYIVAPDDEQGLACTLIRIVAQKKQGELPVAPVQDILQYDRRNLTGELAKILDGVIEKKSKTKMI